MFESCPRSLIADNAIEVTTQQEEQHQQDEWRTNDPCEELCPNRRKNNHAQIAEDNDCNRSNQRKAEDLAHRFERADR